MSVFILLKLIILFINHNKILLTFISELKGLDKQSSIGFLTLLEHLQLCEVGSFFKNPEHPIWVLGSDTHLTVLFSFEKKLVGKETPWEEARRVFKNFDNEGNNFITSKNLGPLMQALGLVCEDD